MIGAVRTYFKIITKKGIKPPRPNSIRKQKSGTNTLVPVFQYPVSQSDDRRIYVWGLADHGGLGTLGKVKKSSDDFNYIAKPSRLWFGENHKIVDIACGYGFTVFGVNDDDGKHIAYGNGINSDSQIGFDDDDLKHYKHDIISVPRPISLPLKKKGTKVIGLAAGRAHLLILTTEGLFTLGNNAYGQCGRPIISHENYNHSSIIHHMRNIKGAKITAVAAGQDHSIIVNENGEVYTFGWGADGQTGLAHYEIESQPSLVKGDIAGERIIKVACASDCVLSLSEKGKVYGWGNSEYGQLPIKGDNHQVNVATEIEDCSKLGHIIDIASGGSFCMILSSTGDVYVWGYGILGFGPQVTKVTIPTLIPNTLFGKNPYQQDVKIVKIYCGINQMAAVTNAGDLYTWGVNRFGNLGIGSCLDQFFPLKVAVGSQVRKLACGLDHTVTLCKPFI